MEKTKLNTFQKADQWVHLVKLPQDLIQADLLKFKKRLITWLKLGNVLDQANEKLDRSLHYTKTLISNL